MITTPDIAQAVRILRDGGLVAFPTETVYGLGADANNPHAVDSIFRVKQRPSHHPLIVHIADIQQLNDWAIEVSKEALLLANTFWPGPLTLVLKKKPTVLDNVTGGQDTIGIRIPKHPMAQALLQAFSSGIAAPSANKFTHISPTQANAVRMELGGQLEMILDGGDSEVGLESTIIDMSAGKPRLLRPGMISVADVAQVLGTPVATMQEMSVVPRLDRGIQRDVRAPGMHFLHYAPRTKTRIVETANLIQQLEELRQTVILSHTDLRTSHASVDVKYLSNNPVDYARALYRTLRIVDALAYREIIIEQVPETAGWDAIRDRIIKASGRKFSE